MRHIIAIPVVAGLVAMAALAAPLAAQARTTDTPVSFTLGAGLLTLTEPASATLTGVAVGAADVTGSLGTVIVADDSGVAAWTATAVATAFTGEVSADSIPATDVSYDAGAISGDTGVGSFTPTAGSITIGTSKTVVTAADVTGAASVNWTPTISIALPSGLVADVYDGEITDSVA